MTVPAYVQPLVWLLVFDVVVAFIWWALTRFGVAFHGQMEQLIIALIVLINVAVVLFWLLGLLGIGGPLRVTS